MDHASFFSEATLIEIGVYIGFFWKISSQSFQTTSHKLETIKKDKMLAKHKCDVFFRIVRNTINFQVMLFSNITDLLHNKMGIIPTEIMKYNMDLKLFWVNS